MVPERLGEVHTKGVGVPGVLQHPNLQFIAARNWWELKNFCVLNTADLAAFGHNALFVN